MYQSAVCALCSLLMFAASTAQAGVAGSSQENQSLPTRAQVVREWSVGIRSNAVRAAKEINREAVKSALTPAALKLELPMLSDSSELGNPVAMVTRLPAISPQAD